MYPKYSHKEWVLNNQNRNLSSDKQQEVADRVVKESQRLIDETQFTTVTWKKEVEYRTKERIDDIKFLIDEIVKYKKEGKLEEEALKTYKQRILNAIEVVKNNAFTITQKCVLFRRNRVGIDIVYDFVDKELQHELAVIIESLRLLNKCLDETSEQIRLLRSKIYQLEQDFSNKQKSLDIEEFNLSLTEKQMSSFVKNFEIIPNSYTCSHEEWKSATHKYIENTNNEVGTSQSVRSFVDILLKQVVESLNIQVSKTNEAFNRRISEMRYTKNRLEDVHNETARQINNILRNIDELEKELQAKEGFLGLTQIRLTNRSCRPVSELCNDNIQNTLRLEQSAQADTLTKLNKMIVESKASLRYLMSSQMKEEEEINIKSNSLKVDEVDCITVRQGLDFPAF